MKNIPIIQQVIAILWPSFLVAGTATVVFFTAFDPQDLLLEISRLGAYTVGFFLFWLFAGASSLLTCYFQRPCDKQKSTTNTRLATGR